MKKLITALLFVSFQAYAGWYCTEVSSSWMEQGKMLQTCGVGQGDNESAARLDAYNNARKEFDSICNKDTLCANKMVNIDPQRTECSESNGVYVCHRLFYYHVTNLERRPAPVFVKEQQEEPQVITTKTEVHNHNQIINNNQTYHVDIRKPVVFKEIIIDKKRSDQYRTFVRKSGAVTIYSTNNRSYTGVYLTDPSEAELEQAIRNGNRGGMTAVYLYNP